MNALQFQNNLLSIQENMMNFALLLTSNHHDAEDLMQETVLKVLDNKDKFVDNSNFKGWVLTVMRNIFINNYHKIIRTQVVIDQIPDFDGLDIIDEFGLETSEYFFQLQELSDAINKLDDELKIPLSMHLSGYKYAEIAKNLKIPLGTVKSRIFFARRELQKELSEFSI
ncbi:MAG: RNA polymerase sigma factor [Tannerellaceae bacterium]|jgi:RNA polymerase sigma-70 factor (ECF subfamily)|nr:RNA polymerase sigma factor [Tannerellaceae bacterium]